MTTNSKEMRFGFGANWADYIKKFYSDERLQISQNHLLNFLKLPDLKGKTFLDIGSGSGLHSLAAWRAGAEMVLSFDYDSNSVATTKLLHEMSGSPANWKVLQGSVLDNEFVASLGKFDVVYSWGVLHHTGKMWEAIKSASSCLKPDGVFYIALYSKDAYVQPPFEYWLNIKREYNNAGFFKKIWMECRYAYNNGIKSELRKGNNPFRFMQDYKQSRGMSFWHDVKDWLGGYPMEFAGNKETEIYAKEHLELELINIKCGEGNTEFLFRPIGSKNYLDEVVSRFPLYAIDKKFEQVGGFAWKVKINQTNTTLSNPAKFMLYEGNSPIGWPGAQLSDIQQWGRGRYRLEQDCLIFSTLEGLDPHTEGRDFFYRENFI